MSTSPEFLPQTPPPPPEFSALPKDGGVQNKDKGKYELTKLSTTLEHAEQSSDLNRERLAREQVRQKISALFADPDQRFASKMINAIIDKKNSITNVAALAEIERKLIEIFAPLVGNDIDSVIEEQMALVNRRIQLFNRTPVESKRSTSLTAEDMARTLPTARGLSSVVKYIKSTEKAELPGTTHELYLNSLLDQKYKVDVFDCYYHLEGDEIVIDNLRLVQVKPGGMGGAGIETNHEQFIRDFNIIARRVGQESAESLAQNEKLATEVDRQLSGVVSDLETSYLNYLCGEIKLKAFEEKIVTLFSDLIYKNQGLHLFNNLSSGQKQEAIDRCFAALEYEVTESAADTLVAALGERMPDIKKRITTMLKRQQSKTENKLYELPILKRVESVTWSAGVPPSVSELRLIDER